MCVYVCLSVSMYVYMCEYVYVIVYSCSTTSCVLRKPISVLTFYSQIHKLDNAPAVQSVTAGMPLGRLQPRRRSPLIGYLMCCCGKFRSINEYVWVWEPCLYWGGERKGSRYIMSGYYRKRVPCFAEQIIIT